jgi:nucleoside-diphosphate-sugar epimerase
VPAPRHVVVTGAGGFLGSRIVDHVLAAGHRVTAVTRTTPPKRLEGVDVVVCDLADGLTLDEPADAVIHAAASLAHSSEDTLARDNVAATASVVRWAIDASVRELILCSTISVYGTVSLPVLTEATEPRSVGPYGRSKAMAEELVELAAPHLRSVILRLPALLGPDATRGPWLVEAAAAMITGDPVGVSNEAAPFNAVVHVDDVAAFMRDLIGRLPSGVTTANLAAGRPLPVIDVVRLLAERLESRSTIDLVPARSSPFVVSVERAQRVLGYRPSTLEAVIERYALDVSRPQP